MTPNRDHPFGEPSADVVFRSSDDIEFKLHTVILSLASEFFKDMFSLPQLERGSAPHILNRDPQSTEGVGDTPVVPVTEPAAVLESLFRLCYPVDDPPLETLDQVRPTLEAALKYQMREAIKITRRRLAELAQTAPLRVYAIACRLSLEDVAASAAKEVCRQAAQDAYVGELEEITVGAYQRLLYYCECCTKQTAVRIRFTFHQPFNTFANFPGLFQTMPLRPQAPGSQPQGQTEPDSIFAHESAEVVITAGDGARLRVFYRIIELASPVLFSMLSAVPPSTGTTQTLSLPETGKVLTTLFRICYPVDNPALADLREILPVFVAAEKYRMAKPIAFLRDILVRQAEKADVDAVQLYLLCSRVGLQDLAQTAARRTLHQAIPTYPDHKLDDFGVTAGALWRLLDYRRGCLAAARAVVADDSWLSPSWKSSLAARCDSRTKPRMCWFNPYFSELKKKDWPSPARATDDGLLRSVSCTAGLFGSRSICSTCTDPLGMMTLFGFSQYVAATIDAREKEIVLEWRYPSCL